MERAVQIVNKLLGRQPKSLPAVTEPLQVDERFKMPEEYLQAPEGTYANFLGALPENQESADFGSARTKSMLLVTKWFSEDTLYILMRVKEGRSRFPLTESVFKIDKNDHVYQFHSFYYENPNKSDVEELPEPNLEGVLAQAFNAMKNRHTGS